MELSEGWEVASSVPGLYAGPNQLGDLTWQPVRVPGTAAAAVGGEARDFDAEDWWFRCRFAAQGDLIDGPATLELDGIATVSEVFLNDELVLTSSSMWAEHRVDVSDSLAPDNELVIACRALRPLLAKRRRPSARWRTRVINNGNLRWYRTMMFGRSPGFAPGPATVGPWRPVRITSLSGPGLASLSLRPRIDRGDGVLSVRATPLAAPIAASVILDDERWPLRDVDGALEAELRVPEAELWWPHTHGIPTLHELKIELDGAEVATRRVGFRSLSWAHDIYQDGLDLHVNEIPIFVRGAVWTPSDLISMAPDEIGLRGLLELVRDGGMNMVRVVGTGAYESPMFHDLCDELGILVWQDLMFANLDYPLADPDFRAEIERETRQVLSALAGRPSLAVVCGNSEVEQQPAMMGLDPELGRSDVWEELIPQVVAETGADCAYIRSTPSGGTLPFHPDRGITHYFGVSGYFGPPQDARRAEVRFASECLAFANVPDEVEVPVHHPRWKSGVPRDAGTGWDLGAGWDFDDVRDHYLGLLYDVDPVQLRRSEHDRYLELSRAASGEVMAEVIGDWRRAASPCRGALVLWLKDMLAGAGLGVLDHRGAPKVAYYHLRRIFSPVAVWMTDERVAGIAIHIANDRPEPLRARLRVTLYQNLEARVDEASEELELPPHEACERDVEALLGHFVDASWAYRFGAPGHDVIVASLERDEPDGIELLSQAFHFPAGRPTARDSADRLGLVASACPLEDRTTRLSVKAHRLAYGVRIHAPGFIPDDDAFSIEPGGERIVRLQPHKTGATFSGAKLTALNLHGPLHISTTEEQPA